MLQSVGDTGDLSAFKITGHFKVACRLRCWSRCGSVILENVNKRREELLGCVWRGEVGNSMHFLDCQYGRIILALDFSDFTFVPCASGGAKGDGAVLVPLSSVVSSDGPPSTIAVVDCGGRSVAYDGGGRVSYVDSLAGTEAFIGWSYWEAEATEALDGPCVNLVVLADGFDPADYRG